VRSRSLLYVLAAALGAAGAMPATLAAQIRASERASISQTIDGTVFTIDYARPQARGRDSLFGRVVQWGEVWTPGANWATTLEVNRDVTLDGHTVKKGKYSVWMVVRPEAWTVVLDPRFQLYHEEHPDSTPDQIRWSVRPERGGFTEALTWSVPEVRPDGAVFTMAWGTVRVPINAQVTPKHPIPTPSDVAAPFVGRYVVEWIPELGAKKDTVELYYDAGVLRQRWTPILSIYPALQLQPMVHIGDDLFIPTILVNGRVREMVSDMVFEFERKDGKVVALEVRDDKDVLLGAGYRLK
jgi:hypothetical protein